jgi:hypothetical protein
MARTGAMFREQAYGESLDPDKLERLGRYEVHHENHRDDRR